MVQRTIAPLLANLFRRYPFVTVTGPRQSGKTTLCRAALPDLAYVNLESPNHRQFAEEDPKRFIATWPGGVILDEIQRVPSLLSWLQVFADDHGGNGLFVLTGSGQFLLSDRIDQSLAGRTALLRLLPFSLDELRSAGVAATAVDDLLFTGFYPRIYDQGLDPGQALADYVETYVERDVRRMLEIRNLSAFQRFVRLCAGRVGQLLNLAALGADAGVTHTTARHWLSVLEASYIVFRLPPYHGNVSKRLVKSPKLYFHDVGLASWLLGIESVRQVRTHPLRGALFENAVVAEALKHGYNRGRRPQLSFFRDSRGLECDLLYPSEGRLLAIEAKSGATIASDWFAALGRVMPLLPDCDAGAVVHGGDEHQNRSVGKAIPLTEFSRLLARFDGAP